MGAFSLIDLKRESSVAPDDDDGNMLTRTDQVTTEVITYGFDDFDRLLSVSSSISGRKQDNRYHTEGLRKRKLDVNDNVSNEYSAAISTAASNAAAPGSTSPTISYIMGHQILGAEVNGNFRFHLMDAQGTVRDVVDDTGAVVKSFEFNEHGLEISSSGSGTFSPKTYQGGLSVNDDTADSGLYLMGNRHFESALLGRFISRDPIGFSGGMNLFNGAGLNPVTFVDPSGLETWVIYSGSVSDGTSSGSLPVSNPFGHLAAKIGGETAVRSFYTDPSQAASLTKYLTSHTKRREIWIIKLPTTDDQDRKLGEQADLCPTSVSKGEYLIQGKTCSKNLMKSFVGAGIIPESAIRERRRSRIRGEVFWGDYPLQTEFPDVSWDVLEKAFPDAPIVHIPQGDPGNLIPGLVKQNP